VTAARTHHFNCGTMCPRLARGLEMVCHVVLVETAVDGLVLVDTGLGTGDLADGGRRLGRMFLGLVGPRLDPAEPAIARVRALGFRPEDVRHIVVTHLDLDHAGGIGDFPWATVHIHARELAAARARASFLERHRYLMAQFAAHTSWQEYSDEGDDWHGLRGIRALGGLGDAVALVPLFGHTRGHSGVAVSKGDRWLLHAGDAYFHHRELQSRDGAPAMLRWFQRVVEIDGPARRSNQDRLRELGKGGAPVDIFCAHDRVELERLARAADPS
jgi:glyoxylase-like metal-dependent hydrolase (beta-lactamase superfamily II)